VVVAQHTFCKTLDEIYLEVEMVRKVYTVQDIIRMDMPSFKTWIEALKTGCLSHVGIKATKYEISSDPKTGDIWLDYEKAK
jgi:hypothetical protein